MSNPQSNKVSSLAQQEYGLSQLHNPIALREPEANHQINIKNKVSVNCYVSSPINRRTGNPLPLNSPFDRLYQPNHFGVDELVEEIEKGESKGIQCVADGI